MEKVKLDPDSLTVETFDAVDHPFVALDTGSCPDTRQTTGPWLCVADCGTGYDNSCAC